MEESGANDARRIAVDVIDMSRPYQWGRLWLTLSGLVLLGWAITVLALIYDSNIGFTRAGGIILMGPAATIAAPLYALHQWREIRRRLRAGEGGPELEKLKHKYPDPPATEDVN